MKSRVGVVAALFGAAAVMSACTGHDVQDAAMKAANAAARQVHLPSSVLSTTCKDANLVSCFEVANETRTVAKQLQQRLSEISGRDASLDCRKTRPGGNDGTTPVDCSVSISWQGHSVVILVRPDAIDLGPTSAASLVSVRVT